MRTIAGIVFVGLFLVVVCRSADATIYTFDITVTADKEGFFQVVTKAFEKEKPSTPRIVSTENISGLAVGLEPADGGTWTVKATGMLTDKRKGGSFTVEVDPEGDLYVYEVTVLPFTPREAFIRPIVEIGLDTLEGESYQVYWAPEPGGPWSPFGGVQNGTGLPLSVLDAGDVDRPAITDVRGRFYRVEIIPGPTRTDLRVEIGDWLSASRVCDKNSFIPITVYNDGTPVVKCVNVEVYHVPWNVCCNNYYWYDKGPCRLAKAVIERITPNSSVTLKIPWHPKQNCNSIKVRVDPDNKNIDPFGAPIPCFWHNPAYPNGHILEVDDCLIQNNNWACSAGNIPTLRPCRWIVVPLPVANPHPVEWNGVIQLDQPSVNSFFDVFTEITMERPQLVLGYPTEMVQMDLTGAEDAADIEVSYDSTQFPLERLLEVTIPPDQPFVGAIPPNEFMRPVLIIHIPLIPVIPPMIPPLILNVDMNELLLPDGTVIPPHSTRVEIRPVIDLGVAPPQQ